MRLRMRRRVMRRARIIHNHQRDRGIAPGKRAQQQTVVLRLPDLRSLPVAVDFGVGGRPVRGEEEGFLQARAAEDGVAEGAGGALAEEEVLLGEVGEDEFEEFGGEGGGAEGWCGHYWFEV